MSIHFFRPTYFPAENLTEYKWPPDETGEYYMLQEQVSEYLGVTSFKRKYPGKNEKAFALKIEWWASLFKLVLVIKNNFLNDKMWARVVLHILVKNSGLNNSCEIKEWLRSDALSFAFYLFFLCKSTTFCLSAFLLFLL